MLKPLGDRIIIEVAKEEEKTIGGIVLASAAQEKPQTGKVIAVGSGRVLENGQTIAPEVKAGETVLFEKFAGTEVKHDGKEYLVLRADQIAAIVE
ncbi:MAG: co-chaperone GroES [Streptococcaceae bacterium]|nr:co-chaperone GroES [Streptococcaceae bacterium]